MPTVKSTVREVLPEITGDKIAPPSPDYPDFQGIDAYPFRPHADAFDMVNAWWLIEAPTLAHAYEAWSEKFYRLELTVKR